MKILVCGGRNYGHVVRTQALTQHEPPETQERLKEYKFIQDSLGELIDKLSVNYNPNDNWLPTDITIIHGGARGADSATGDFAAVNFCKEEVYQADWNTHGKAAGFIRNKQMLVEGLPDLVVAFPGGKGTAMMVKLAKTAGVRVIEMGSKGSQTMTTQYTGTDLRIMLNQAILSGDKIGEAAIKQALADEYDEIMQAQELVDKANGTNAD